MTDKKCTEFLTNLMFYYLIMIFTSFWCKSYIYTKNYGVGKTFIMHKKLFHINYKV